MYISRVRSARARDFSLMTLVGDQDFNVQPNEFRNTHITVYATVEFSLGIISVHGKKNFTEMFKNLLFIIYKGYRVENNFVELLKLLCKTIKYNEQMLQKIMTFQATSLNVSRYNYFDGPKLFSDLIKFLDTSAKSFIPCIKYCII